MILPQGTLVAVANGEKFELYRNVGTATEPRLASEDVPDLDPSNFSAGARDKDKISRFTPGEGKDRIGKLEESAHAIAIVEWLNQKAITNQLDKLVLVADPRSLGEMRRHYHVKLKDALLCDLDRNLAGAKGPQILAELETL